MKLTNKKHIFVLLLILISQTMLYPNIRLWFTPYTKIEGVLKTVGTSLFYNYVIDTTNGERYYIDKSIADDFKSRFGENIKLKAKVVKKKIRLADKSKTFTQLTIMEYKDLE